MRLDGKIAWVVGGSGGIGAAVARELVRRGATVAISARREEQLRDVAGGDMVVLPADVTDGAAVAAAAEQVREKLGPIDIAVLSAGYWKQMNPEDWDTSVFDQHLRVNLAGMSNSIAAVLPDMLRRHHGVIAGITSVAGYRGLAGAEAYGATKAAQINLLESLRVHIARTGVHVTTICPGFVRTDLTAGNQFPMPFMIDAGQAAHFICDGLERERTQIAFPAPMRLLMQTARLVPARAWAVLWARTSIAASAPPSTTTPMPGKAKDAIRVQQTVIVAKPLDAVFHYLSDFANTTEWDPGTVVTLYHHGDGGVGTTYLNTSAFLGRKTRLTYVVREFIRGQRIRLRGENKTVIAVDIMTFRKVDAGTEVVYTADFTFKAPPVRLLAPLFRPALERLGRQAQAGMREALNQL